MEVGQGPNWGCIAKRRRRKKDTAGNLSQFSNKAITNGSAINRHIIRPVVLNFDVINLWTEGPAASIFRVEEQTKHASKQQYACCFLGSLQI
jgi:hypothetical protein